MPNNQPQVNPKVLAKDRKTLVAVKALPFYDARNADFELPKLEAAASRLQAAEERFVLANAEWDTARDELAAAKRAFHDAMVGARGQVSAQFGRNSTEVQAVGLKRKSERKRPGPKPGSKRKPRAEASAS